MYIKQLKQWKDKDWQQFFTKHNILPTDVRIRIRKILESDKKTIEKNFLFLKNWEIINWVWPYWFPQFLVDYITKTCPYVRWEFHDLWYLFAENEKDRLKADAWLLYYSLIDYPTFSQRKVIYLTYCMVRLFWKLSIKY